MKNNVKSGDRVFFFFTKSDADANNNASRIAPATIVGRPWSSGTVNLKVHTDCSNDLVKTSVMQALSVTEAIDVSNKWATAEQCAAWGIDLSDAYQELTELLSGLPEAAPAAESKGE